MPDAQLFNRAIDDPKLWKRSGNELFKRGLYKIALKFYARAIELNPGFIEAWNNLGLSFLKIGKIEEARRCNEKVRELKYISGGSQKDAHAPAGREDRPLYSFKTSKSQTLMNDNFWYAFCIAILIGICLVILNMNNPIDTQLQTLGYILGLSALCFIVLFLLLQYALRIPKK